MGIFDSKLFMALSVNLLLYQSIFHLPIVVAAKDTLFPGDELSVSSLLASSNGIFTLGFVTISPSTHVHSNGINLTYLGIWLTNWQRETLWIANRDQPIDGNDAILTMDASSGTLRVKNRSGATLFDVSDDKIGLGNKNNTRRAMLHDSGNFIVYDIITNRTIWESFDHPTYALVPGMKLGYNLTAKKNWELTSAANDEVPTSGAFTMRLENYQESPQLLIYRHGDLYWASGPWNKTTGTFQWLYNALDYTNNRFELTYDPSGMYLFVEIIGSGGASTLSPKGGFPANYDPGFCYGSGSEGVKFPDNDILYGESEGVNLSDNNISDGCVVSELPHCRAAALTSVNDVYWWDIGSYVYLDQLYSYHGPIYKIDDNSSISLGDCMERCWNDCGCVACSTYNNNGTGCIYGTEHINPGEVKLAYFRYHLASGKSPQFKYPKKLRWILLSLSIVPVLVLAYVMIRIRIIKGKENRRRDDIVHQLTTSNIFNYGDELERGIQEVSNVKIFSLKAVLSATNNFSIENKLGQGGYGPVYKGELSDGRKIAVKRLSKTSGQGILEFKSELTLISKLQHKNLVRLYGCCIHQEERMLIYEFMPNKSLDFFLFDDDNKAKIDWEIRFKIIEGIALGLLYLHKYSRMKVIHRDLKVSNVLLDENMNPKISDFGMARIFQQDMSILMTKRIAGTYGYMAPEYVIHRTFSIKSDIFSFGVIILEIVSGKKNSSFHRLLKCAWKLWKRETTLELKDEALDESFDANQLIRIIHIGLLCVQEHANDRPTMSQVYSMLNDENADLPIPRKPVFFIHPDEVDISRSTSTEHLLGNNIHGSVNGLTITAIEAR